MTCTVTTISSVQPVTILSSECIVITITTLKYFIFKRVGLLLKWMTKWFENVTWLDLLSFTLLFVLASCSDNVQCRRSKGDLSMSELIWICLQMHEDDFKWFGSIALGISCRLRLWHTFTVLTTFIRKTVALLVYTYTRILTGRLLIHYFTSKLWNTQM